jgi:hypothetical protein
MAISISFGSYKSENWVQHLNVTIEGKGCAVTLGFAKYPNSCTFSNVVVHQWSNSEVGEPCLYSPTNFCNSYEQIKWENIPVNLSLRICIEILIERIENVYAVANFILTDEEKNEIRNAKIQEWEG